MISQRSWPWKVKVIGQNKWHQRKGFYSSYLVLKFGNILPIRNWNISRNVISKGHDLETSGTIGFLDLTKIVLDTKIVILSSLFQKLWSKTSFCIMVANIMCSLASHVQITQDIFHLLKGPDTSYLVLKFSNILPINNWDMAQNVISQRSWPWKVKTNGTIRFLDLENIYLGAKIVILSALAGKLWSKMSFCLMVANVTHSRTSHVQTA